MDKKKIIGTWKLKRFSAGTGQEREEWAKDGFLLIADAGYFSVSVNYIGNVIEDRKKRYTARVIRDFFGAGKYEMISDSEVQFSYLNSSLPERVGFNDARKVSVDKDTLTEVIDRGDLQIEVVWEIVE